MKVLLPNVKYEEYQWLVCGDFKVIGILLGQQTGYTKMPCFMCEWNSRTYGENWSRREWPKRENVLAGSKNIVNKHFIASTAHKIRTYEAVCESIGQSRKLFPIPV